MENNTDKHPYTLILVEDDNDIRQRLETLINSHDKLDLVNSSATMTDGLATLKQYKPDILVTDLGLPDGSGIEIIRAINQYHLDCQAMVISGFQDEHLVFEALEAGAKSYILKQDNSLNIIDAILSMMAGGATISPVIARLMLHKFQPVQEPTAIIPEALTERQLKILKLVSQGFSSKEISQKLNISYYTVTTHIKNIYNKLQVNSRTEALCEAVKQGFISL